MFTKSGLENASFASNRIGGHDFLFNQEDYLFDGTDRTYNQVQIELPHPIHKPFQTIETDSLKKLVQEKQQYHKLLEGKRKIFKADEKKIHYEKISDSKYLYLPKHLLEFYRTKDPDPYFDCDYNFYYTGGYLEHVQLNNIDYLIRPNGQDKLCFSDLNEPDNTVMLNYDLPSTIFNIKAAKNNDSCLLVIRGKHTVDIADICSIEEVKNIWTHKHQIPVLDAKLNHLNFNQIGIIDANSKLNVREVETGRTVVSYKNISDIKTDRFQQFQFLDQNCIALCDRFHVKIIDCRTKTIKDVFNPDLLACNSLCNFEIRGNDLFLSSRHYLIKSDLRKLDIKSYFSHSMRSVPCYMSFETKNNDTFLCLAGQEASQYKVLYTGKSLFGLPYKVPDIQSTLKECRLTNPRLVLQDQLDERLNFSVAGLKVLNVNNDIFIYWSNSLGEIFRQKVSDDEPDKNEPIEMLSKWINNLEKIDPVLHLTYVQEMSSARFALNTNPIEKNLYKYKEESTSKKFLEKFRPVYSKRNVTSKLAQDFLTVWDDDDSEEEGDTEKLPEVPVLDKVNNWIQTHDFSDDENSLGFLNTSKS